MVANLCFYREFFVLSEESCIAFGHDLGDFTFDIGAKRDAFVGILGLKARLGLSAGFALVVCAVAGVVCAVAVVVCAVAGVVCAVAVVVVAVVVLVGILGHGIILIVCELMGGFGEVGVVRARG